MQVQQSAVVDVTLKVGQTTTEVTVRDVTPMLTVDNPTLGHTLDRERIEQLPISGRMFQSLVAIPSSATVPMAANLPRSRKLPRPSPRVCKQGVCCQW